MIHIKIKLLEMELPKFEFSVRVGATRNYSFVISAANRVDATHQLFSDLALIRTEVNNFLQKKSPETP